MEKQRLVPLMISLSREDRDYLRTLAARRNLENPNQVVTAAQIAREIIIEYLEKTGRNINYEKLSRT